MQLIRTTLRIQADLKKQAEKIAFDQERTLQDIFQEALSQYLNQQAKKKASKIHFKTHNLGVPLDNLTRDAYYD